MKCNNVLCCIGVYSEVLVRNIFMRQIIILFLVTLISCNKSNQQADYSTTEKEDDGFDSFLRLFERRMTTVPKNFEEKFLKIDTTQISNAWTYERVDFSDDLIGLVYKEGCLAGGVCERFVLVIFDKQGKRVSSAEIGHHFADYGSDSELTYAFDKNRIEFKLKVIERFELEDGTEKEKIKTDSTYFGHVDLKNGKISAD